MGDKKRDFVTLRMSDDELSNLDLLAAELSRLYPHSEKFNRSQVIRWCIRSASSLLVSQGTSSAGQRSDTP